MFRALTVVAASVVIVAGQTPTPNPQAPVFRTGVDLVRVDVTVLDKNRQPVHGLKLSDFTLLEDGKPQTIQAFSAVDIPDAPPTPVVMGKPVTWMREIAPDVRTNDPASGRLIVLLIDDAAIPGDPKIIANARSVIRTVIDRLGPTDRTAVVLSQDGRLSQDFTNDHARLLAAAEKMQPGRAQYTFGWESAPTLVSQGNIDPFNNPLPGPDLDNGVRDSSFRTLRMVSEALIASPERRKTLIYVSPGMPLNYQMAASTTMSAGGQGGVRTLMNREAMIRIVEQMPDLFREMQRANVVVYAIDPAGPGGIENYIAERMRQLEATSLREFNLAPLDPATGIAQKPTICNNQPHRPPPPFCYVPEPFDFGHIMGTFSRDFLATAATNTGGRVIYTENYEETITQIFRESGSYYMLGYRAPVGNKPGDLHRLKVTVNRPGVEVQMRSGYATPAPEKTDPKKVNVSPASKALAGLLPASDLSMQVALAPVASPDKTGGAVIVTLGLQMPAPNKPLADAVQVELRAFTPDGQPRGTQIQDAFIAVRPSTIDEIIRYEALSSIALKPGRYQLRIGAYSGAHDEAGGVYADVDVPDFSKAALSLSGVMITSSPAVPASPVEAIARLAPVVPTSARVFQKLDRVGAFVRVYLGSAAKPGSPGAPSDVTVRTRLMNEQGVVAFEKADTLPVARFTGTPRSSDVRFDVPMMTLARGGYWLSIEATYGEATVRRDVRFAVK